MQVVTSTLQKKFHHLKLKKIRKGYVLYFGRSHEKEKENFEDGSFRLFRLDRHMYNAHENTDLKLRQYITDKYLVQIAVCVKEEDVGIIEHSLVVLANALERKPVRLWNAHLPGALTEKVDIKLAIHTLIDMLLKGRIDVLPGFQHIPRDEISTMVFVPPCDIDKPFDESYAAFQNELLNLIKIEENQNFESEMFVYPTYAIVKWCGADEKMQSWISKQTNCRDLMSKKLCERSNVNASAALEVIMTGKTSNWEVYMNGQTPGQLNRLKSSKVTVAGYCETENGDIQEVTTSN